MAKKHPEHVNLERWLVSYADFITLLFAFFVIMYAISRADVQKFKTASASLKKAFGGVVESGSTGGGNTIVPFDTQRPEGGTMIDMPEGKTNTRTIDNVELKHLAEVLEESLSFELGKLDAAEKMQITYDNRGVVVRLMAKGFFDPGAADVRPDAIAVLDQIAKVIGDAGRPVRVEGHTDNGKTSSQLYPSNWELSTARAAWIVRYLIQKHHYDPRLLAAAGYAEYHPIAPNDTESGRSRNRRVEILVLSK
ncbi:MAG: OmpA family protein [Deltaproteobacteria bacterium]|nr:OmpA family protein [Deltaproteobacteria bacterium]